MVLAYAIILLVILALLFQRDLSAIGRITYRGGWIPLAGVIVLFIVQAAMVLYVPGQTTLQRAILMLSQITLIFLILLNHHVPGAKLFALGIILNATVMLATPGAKAQTCDGTGANFIDLNGDGFNDRTVVVPIASLNTACDVPDTAPVAVRVKVTPKCCVPGEKPVSTNLPSASATTSQSCGPSATGSSTRFRWMAWMPRLSS